MEKINNIPPEESKNELNFNKEDLEVRAKQNGWKLNFEKLDWEPLYPGIDKNSPDDMMVLVAHLRSLKYPEITATSKYEKSSIQKIERDDPTIDINERVYSWLCSNGHSEIEKKELLFMGALEKEKFIENNSDLLEKEQVRIEEISPSPKLSGEEYSYNVVTRSTLDDTPGSFHADTVNEAVHESIKEIRRWQKIFEEDQKRLWKEDPEFMYTKGDYEEKLNELKMLVTRWGHEKEKDNYFVSIGPKRNSYSWSKTITADGTNWKEAFETVIDEAEKIIEEEKNESKKWFKVNSFSNQDLNTLLDAPDDEKHGVYFDILTQKFQDSLKNKEEIKLNNEELLAIQKKAIEDEKYEIAAVISNYMNKEKK